MSGHEAVVSFCETAFIQIMEPFSDLLQGPICFLHSVWSSPSHEAVVSFCKHASMQVMDPFSDLFSICRAQLAQDTDYAAQLRAAGYRTPNAVTKAASAERLQHACGLLPGDADVIWASRLATQRYMSTSHVVMNVRCLVLAPNWPVGQTSQVNKHLWQMPHSTEIQDPSCQEMCWL